MASSIGTSPKKLSLNYAKSFSLFETQRMFTQCTISGYSFLIPVIVERLPKKVNKTILFSLFGFYSLKNFTAESTNCFEILNRKGTKTR
jgi:hypothetical protein